MRPFTLANSAEVAPRMPPMLWRKLWADARALRRQTIGLTVLIGLGLLLFIGLYEAHQNLVLTYSRIYRTTLFADASVLFESGPPSLVDRARRIPHVRAALGRMVKDGAIIQRGRKRERVLGRFVAMPRGRRPAVNDLWLVAGRYLGNSQEVVLEHQFARDNGYALGDVIKCSYLNRERDLTIVGFAASPEYVYPVPSRHALFVARGTFGVVFVEEDRAREWFATGNQINEIHCLTDPGYQEEVVEKLRGLAHSYGVDFAYVQDQQPSKRLLDMDQQGFATMSVFFPILFLSAAGLSLYGALSRITRLQVTVIGTLRACGLTRREILYQHILLGVLVSLGGAVPGVILGHLMAIWLNGLYANALHLPAAEAAIHWDTVFVGFLLAIATGLAAAYLPARLAAGLPPAAAMRGDVESARRLAIHHSLDALIRRAPVFYRIPLRGIFRRASRTFLALSGIAGGACLMMTTLGQQVATMAAIDEFLTGTRKYEIDLQLTRPSAAALARAATGVPGGRSVGLTVSLPVRVASSWGEGEAVLTGLERGQTQLAIRTVSGEPMALRAGSIWLPKRLAQKLQVESGDPVHVEWVRSSRRNRLRTTMQVAGMVDVSMGASAYGEYNDVRRALADRAWPHSSYGANFDCDPAHVEAFRNRFERSDDVMLVSTTSDVAKDIDEQMALMYLFIGVLLSFGSVLAGSSIHSVASVSLLERTRELASLRSLGFSAWSAAWLAGLELFFLAAGGLIIGLPLGAALNSAFIQSFQTETMSFRAILPPWTYLLTVAIVLALVVASAWVGARRLAALSLPEATKARE